MWTNPELDELLAYQPGTPVLSVYLDLDPSAAAVDTYKLELRQLIRPFQEEARPDAEAVVRFFEHEYDGSGRAIAIFSCQADDYFRAFPLHVPVRSRARHLPQPYVKPLADLLDTYGHFGIALVDREKARFLHLHLGELLEELPFEGQEIQHTKRGGGSQAPGRRGGTAGQTRYTEEMVERNLREAAAKAADFFHQHEVRRVMLGGTEDTLAFFREALPKSWQSLVIGSFPVSMTAGPNEVIARALGVAAEAEMARERKLVERAVTAAAKGGNGVVSLDSTLEAVHSGRVQILLLSEAYRQPGYRCSECGYLTVQSLPNCPFCQGSFAEIEDAVELAVRKVLAKGGQVEVLHDNPDLVAAGNIAALLRY